VDAPSVLIFSDDAEFPRQISARWQTERTVPAFIVRGSDFAKDLDGKSFDLAIVGPSTPAALKQVLRILDPSRRPLILVSGRNGQKLRADFPRLLCIHEHEGWPDTVVLLASEVLRRVEATERAERAELVNSHLKCNATLGQYVLDMRHTMNNALTSVLGNSELLLLEPGTFSAGVRSQLDTIRNMSLRLHEILQRFSSLEKELRFVEKQAEKEQGVGLSAAAGL
jgi:signal transduction histidine kinase